MKRTLRSLAALTTLGLIVAGCSSTSGGTSAAGTTSTGTASTGTTRSTNARYRKAVKFAVCMRTNGVSAFPNPDASGGLTIDGVANGSSVDTSSAAFERAFRACKDLEPPGFTGHKRSRAQQKAALAFARCVRRNGVPDFPNPSPDAPLIDTNRIPSLAGKDPRSVPVFASAIDNCGAMYAKELGLPSV